jgi:hypothetical protein
VEHAPDVPDCQDSSQAHQTVVDGLQLDDSVPLINCDNVIIQKGIVLNTIETLKIWLTEYAVFHHRPFIGKNSNENKCYVVICRHGCPWTVSARRRNDDTWRIISVVQPHTCCTNVDDTKHPQLSSRYISQRLVNIIKSYPH